MRAVGDVCVGVEHELLFYEFLNHTIGLKSLALEGYELD